MALDGLTTSPTSAVEDERDAMETLPRAARRRSRLRSLDPVTVLHGTRLIADVREAPAAAAR